MDKNIKENDIIRWRVTWIAVGVLTVPLLVLGIVAMCMKKVPAADAMVMGLVVIAIPAGLVLVQKFGRDENSARRGWILRDEGLERIYSSGEREIILWQQIQRMFWTPIAGLIVLYNEQPERRGKPSRKLGRGTLAIEKPEATEIADCWRKHCPADEADRARRVMQRRRIGVGLMCAGVVTACVVGPLVYQACQSYQWPSVDGKISSMEYELNHSSKYPMGDVQISYKYSVGGNKYSSDRFRPLSKGYRDEAARIKAFVTEHRQGMLVKVYYDPKRPAEAVLLQGPEWGSWGPLLPEGPLLVILGWLIRRKELRSEF